MTKSIAKSSITSKDKFFIAVANEGRYKGIRYKESNVELENAIEKQLSNYVANIICAGHILDLESAKTIAKSKVCDRHRGKDSEQNGFFSSGEQH